MINRTIKNDPEVIASAVEQGILIYTTGSWAVAIAKNDAMKYADKGVHLSSIDSSGFISQLDNEEIILSHGEAKITLENNAANAIIDLIHTAENEIWL
ncbi:MAG: hypothetical protein ACXW00_00340 [Methylobacter sp.]